MRKFFSIIKYPLSIAAGVLTYFWLLGLETLRIPVIISWIPNLIGWKAFLILLSIFAGLVVLLTFAKALDEIPDD